jgi:hypothetical protein
MPDVDLFQFFRISVGWVATIYATIVAAQSLYGWYVYFSSADRYTGMMRRYVFVQALRLRFRAFWGDVLISLLLCVAFLLIWQAHYALWDAAEAWQGVNARP